MGMIRRLALFALIAVAAPVQAGEITEFDDSLAKAWAHYRDALYQSAPGRANAAATIEALAAFTAAWDGLSERWADHPPPHYGEDRDFAQELAAIAEVTAQARHQAKAGHVVQTHATLEQIRALLAEMRHKNGLESFTDQFDAFDEKLAETADDGFEQAELTPEQYLTLVEQVAVLTYLAERLEKRAPPRLIDDAYFLEMTEDIARQLRGLKAAVLDAQRDPLVAALADLRRSFDRLYFYYG